MVPIWTRSLIKRDMYCAAVIAYENMLNGARWPRVTIMIGLHNPGDFNLLLYPLWMNG